MKAHYNPQITEASQKELLSFSHWMNQHYGNYPIIVGGWAVYAHLSRVSSELGKAKLGSMQLGFVPLGSRDIDVVFASQSIMDKILLTYFKYNDFVPKKSFLETSYVKEVKTPLGIEQIFIDACTLKDVREIPDLKIKLPWKLVGKNNELFSLDSKTKIYIPIIELLLMQKIGACIGRTLQRKTSPSNYLESKIWKDTYDIVNLAARLTFNQSKLKKFLQQNKIEKHLDILFSEIQNQKDTLTEAKTTINQIKQKMGY